MFANFIGIVYKFHSKVNSALCQSVFKNGFAIYKKTRYSVIEIAKPGYPSGQRGRTVNPLAQAFAGSNPAPGTSKAGIAQLAEQQPSKL